MSFLDSFAKVKVLVIGDCMLDRYWWGSVRRISPEAPVPVVELHDSTYAPGGAANVAANIAGLGATAILIGCIGNDPEAGELVSLLEARNVSGSHLVRSSARSTIVKTRVIAHSQQVVRVDRETTAPLSTQEASDVWSQVSSAIAVADVVVLSDYAKGLLSNDLINQTIAAASRSGKKILVDPKGKDYSKYSGANLITPNRREAAEACNLDERLPELVDLAGTRLLATIGLPMVLITQGEDGMTLFEREKTPIHIPTAAKETYDVTGAGDTVIACLGVAIGAGMDFFQAASVSNVAAGLVVEQVGTTAITRLMLENSTDFDALNG